MTLINPYALCVCLLLCTLTPTHAITLYSQSSGNWGPTAGTIGLFNDAANGTGTAYDGNTIAWQGATVDIVIQTGHTIAFQHPSFTMGNLTVEVGAKLFSNDDSNFFNYILDVRGSDIIVDGKLGNGVPLDPDKADRIGLATQGGSIVGLGDLTLRELLWNFQAAPLKVVATLNMHMYYLGTWHTFYLYNQLGSGTAQELTIGTGGHLNIYGNFAADFDLKNPNTGSSNATDFAGKLIVDGTMTIQDGNLLLKNDNATGQDFTLVINKGGWLQLAGPLIGNGGSGDPAPYPGNGIDQIEVHGTLESQATDPILYTSARSIVNMNANLTPISTMMLSGDANQLLDDDVLGGRYQNVVLAGIGPKRLEGATAIDSSLIFNAGNLELGDHDLNMTKTFMSGETNNTFVNAGPSAFVETNGLGSLQAHMPAGSFFGPGYLTLPVGKSTYNAVTFQSYGLVGDFMSARVADQVLTNGSTGSPITSHVLNKTWFIEEAVPGGSSLNMTFAWTIQDQSMDFNQSKTYISHYTNNNWDTNTQYPNGQAAAASSGIFTVTRNGANSFSPFTVFSLPSSPLPVEWLAFEAQPKAGQVKLDWSTAWEEDNEHFLVEHSINGQKFETIGKVASQGSASLEQSYTFWHQRPALGLNYYRLKQVDYSGEFEYSKIISAQVEEARQKDKLLCFPNPVSQTLQVQLSTEPHPSSLLFIVNGKGQILKKTSVSGVTMQLEVSKLPPGLYTLLLQTPNENTRISFVKK